MSEFGICSDHYRGDQKAGQQSPVYSAAEKSPGAVRLLQETVVQLFDRSGIDGKKADRYLFWTSLNTDKVGAGKEIPVIVQTGDGKYYVSETTTGKRTKNGSEYVAVSQSLTSQNQYKQILKNGEEFFVRGGYYYSPSAGGSSASPKTTDPGVALYAAAALLSTAGLAWNGRRCGQ